jgi:Tfp pilus assembly protein PilF
VTSARTRLLACLLLVLGVAAVYGRTAGFEYVFFDDDTYVTANPVVSEGLTLAGVRWAFTEVHGANWHPLTWLSHMLDVQLFGLAAGPPHLVNAGLHALSAVLLFLFLAGTTRRTWPAFFAAALFAWHPLRVESVAWVAERKDVLSGAFFFLTLLAYARYAREPGRGRYVLVALCLVLGLLTKPMLVTLPFVLLLLDRWPLERTRDRSWKDLVLEKAPLFVLVTLASALTFWAQDSSGAAPSAGEIALGLRLENALAAFGIYLGQTLWPAGLACFYPHAVIVAADPGAALLVPSLLGGTLLLGGSAAVLVSRRSLPELTTGWWWTVGMLLPVIGIVQVGLQAHADRYTYLPLVGLTAATCALGARLVDARPTLRLPLVVAAVLASLACLVASYRQVGVWRDSETLFAHATRVTADNFRAHGNLGYTLLQEERWGEAALQFEEAARIHPIERGVLAYLGLCYLRTGELDRAEEPLRRAVGFEPENALAYSCLGELDLRRGDSERAARRFQRALEIDALRTVDRVSLGLAYLNLGRSEAGRASFEEALAGDPDHPLSHHGMGELERTLGNWTAAREHYERALELDPWLAATHLSLALVLEELGDRQGAAEHRRAARTP